MEVTEAPQPALKVTIGNEKLCKITEKASEKLTSLLTRQGRPNGALRLAVIGGGCSGLQYKMDLVQVANRKFLAAHPGAAADFLRASFRAFSYCVAHSATCVGYLAQAQGPSFDIAHGEAEWRIESTLALDHHVAGKGIGVQTLAEWAPEARAVAQYKLVHGAVDLATAEDTSLAASLYQGTRLIWP